MLKKNIAYILLQVEVVLIAAVLAYFIGKTVGEEAADRQLKEAMAAIELLEQQQEELKLQVSESQNNQTLAENRTDVNVLSPQEQVTKEQKELDEETFVALLDVLRREEPNLILVNKEYKLPDDYEVTLKRLPDKTNRSADIAYDALMDMLSDGRKEGLNFEICSSYRSVARQQELIDEDVNALMRKGYSYEEAYEETIRETMPPGYSEHSTGLAFDIVALSYQILDEKQEKTAEVQWLQEHCYDYGFILRYPKGKEDITGIDYESWHYRYVGMETASYIKEKEITFEEYIREYLQENQDIYKQSLKK